MRGGAGAGAIAGAGAGKLFGRSAFADFAARRAGPGCGHAAGMEKEAVEREGMAALEKAFLEWCQREHLFP
jgi:hypothetical protein